MPISAVPDHVAAAVPRIDDAHARWRDQLGAGDLAGDGPFIGFRNHQYRFRGGAALELLEGDGDERTTFVRAFLERFGARVHHLTLKVDDLPTALRQLDEAGLPVVDVSLVDERWREAFVRPTAIGGLIVQVGSSTLTEDDWAELTGFTRTDPAPDGAVLLGPLLQHPDLERSQHVWRSLGGDVAEVDHDLLEVTWEASPLSVRIRRGETAQPVGLRFEGCPPLPEDPRLGPAVLPG